MRPKFIILHHSAVSRQANSMQFMAINNYHKSLWNFRSKIGYYGGYHYLIEPNGAIKQFRAEDESAAHCYQGNMNNQSIGICLTGNFDIEKPTSWQVFALRDLLRSISKKYGIGRDRIFFHRDYAINPATKKALKSCPGKFVDRGFIRSLINLERSI